MVRRGELTADMLRRMVAEEDDLDVVRTHYCYQLGSTFVNLALMEDAIINAMAMCDRIKVANLLGADARSWQRLQAKTDKLKSSTLGNLIAILAKHGILPSDLAYLRWVKDRRDFFIHRFFHEHDWPGELNEGAVTTMCRRLLYLETIFARASKRIWNIFANAGLLTRVDLGESGALLMNAALFRDP